MGKIQGYYIRGLLLRLCSKLNWRNSELDIPQQGPIGHLTLPRKREPSFSVGQNTVDVGGSHELSWWSPDSWSGLLAKMTRFLLLFTSPCKVPVPLRPVCRAMFSLLWSANVSAPWVTYAQQRWLSDERVTWPWRWSFGFLTFVKTIVHCIGAATHKESLLSFLGAVRGVSDVYGAQVSSGQAQGHLFCVFSLSEHSGSAHRSNFIYIVRSSTPAATVKPL